MSPSSRSCLAPYWTTKQLLTNSLVQFGYVGHQAPKSKVNGPRVHFPYNIIISSNCFVMMMLWFISPLGNCLCVECLVLSRIITMPKSLYSSIAICFKSVVFKSFIYNWNIHIHTAQLNLSPSFSSGPKRWDWDVLVASILSYRQLQWLSYGSARRKPTLD